MTGSFDWMDWESARERMVARFSWEAAADRLIQILDEAEATPRQPRDG